MSKPRPLDTATRRSLGQVFLVVFLDLVGFSIIFPLFPAMLEWYLAKEGEHSLIGQLVRMLEALTPGEVPDPFLVTVLFGGILGSLYSLLQFAFSPIWGRLSDRHGRRSILLLTVGGTALSYLLWIFSGSFLLLLFARAMGGVMAGNIAVATAAVADVTKPEERSRGMGLIGMAFGLGFIIGPALGGTASYLNLLDFLPSAENWGLHPFSLPAFIALILALTNWIWIARGFKETRPVRSTPPPVIRGSRFAFFGIKYPAIRSAINVYLVLLTAFAAMEFTLTFLAVERFAYEPGQLTVVFVFVGLVLAFTQGWFVRRYAAKIGETRCVLAGLVLASLGLIALGFANGVPLFYTGLALLGIGIGITSPTLTSLVSLYSDAENQGANLGAFRSAGSLARAVGPFCGALLFWSLGSATAYVIGAATLGIACLLALRLPKPSEN
jgi:MFS family permease